MAGIWDIKEERREYARRKGVHVYESMDDLLADESTDLVLAATPNDVHKEIAVRAMEAGKNVVSEKPVTLCSADLAVMREAAERTGKFFTVHQNRRWDEDFLTVKNVLAQGKLGEIFRIESRVHGSAGSRATGGRSRSTAAGWCWTRACTFWIRRFYFSPARS